MNPQVRDGQQGGQQVLGQRPTESMVMVLVHQGMLFLQQRKLTTSAIFVRQAGQRILNGVGQT